VAHFLAALHISSIVLFQRERNWTLVSIQPGRASHCGSIYRAKARLSHRLIRKYRQFGHTYATLLKGKGEDVKVVQELMRHANISVTLNVYAQAITQTKRDPQSRVVNWLPPRLIGL
jgi:integrase